MSRAAAPLKIGGRPDGLVLVGFTLLIERDRPLSDLHTAAKKARIPRTQLKAADSFMPFYQLSMKTWDNCQRVLDFGSMPCGQPAVSKAFALCHRNSSPKAATR